MLIIQSAIAEEKYISYSFNINIKNKRPFFIIQKCIEKNLTNVN